MPSQHDRRANLARPNRRRQKTKRARFPLTGMLAHLLQTLSSALDQRAAFRLLIISAGMMLADDRRTASAWFIAAGVRDDWDLLL